MSAVHATVIASGTQYRVKNGDVITVNRLSEEVGEQIELKQVLLVEKAEGGIATADGAAVVTATVTEHLRGKKIRVFKMRRRKKSRRTQGHRQDLTRLTIDEIKVNS